MSNSALKSALSQEANSNKGVPLGSLFGPSYIESYAQAWKELLPNVRKLALPVLYLQRHTLELLVKDLLLRVLKTRSDLHSLDDLFETTGGAGPAEPKDLEKAHTTHSFDDLFQCLERNLAALRLPSLPEAFTKARELFNDVDENYPDRLRYETVFRGKQRSFPTGLGDGATKFAPCDQVGSLLDEILVAREASLSALLEHTDPPTTDLAEFYTAVLESYQESEEEVLHRLSPITEATRNGEIKWEEVSSSSLNIDKHQDLKHVKSAVADVCLEARFCDRLLTVVILNDSNGRINWRDSGFFLATRHPDGTLTAGVWVSGYPSNLVYEIQESFRRR